MPGSQHLAEATETQARACKARADRVVEWGVVEGALRFRGWRDGLVIIRERNEELDGGWVYATRGSFDLAWGELQYMALKLDGQRWTKERI